MEKVEKYQLLREVPDVGELRAVSDMFDKHMEKLGATIRLEVIQKTALLGTARLPRNAFSL